MHVRINQDPEKVKAAREALKANKGYCPCAIVKDDDTKCMCKEFKLKVVRGYIGECDCGLYESLED